MTVVIICKHALFLSVLYTIIILVLSDVKEETSVESDRGENTIDETIVEFKTQSPPDHGEEPKNCYEYLYGKLSAIRKHGATWQNGVADCSNCTCDNGDIRCFFHFCNGPSMGYMTPPTTEEDLILSPPSTPEEDIIEDLISSGQRPREVDEEDEGIEEETTLPVNLKTEGSKFDTGEVLSDGSSDGGSDGEEKDRTENETHHIYKALFCDKTCKKSCSQGFKVDRVAGCWKCQCNKCPTHVTCETKCPFGYAVDLNGCETCMCSIPSESNNEDIVFTDDYNEVLRHLNNDIDNTLNFDNDYIFDQSPDEEVEERSNSSNISSPDSESNSSSSSEEYDEDNDDEDYETQEDVDSEDEDEDDYYNNDEGEEDENVGKEIESIEEANEEELDKAQNELEDNNEEKKVENDKENEEEQEEEKEEDEKRIIPPPGKIISTFQKVKRMPHVVRLTPEDIELTSYPSIREENTNNDVPCNNTHVRGCLDGERKFPVGGSWSRGPCVACRCMAPGYSECNITQCHGLHNCPENRRFAPPGACCRICKEDIPVPAFIERPHESRSTSRVPTELLPLKHSTSNFKEDELKKEETIITSIPKDEQPHLLSILVPMGIVCGVGAFLFVILWRKYHSDKYDINSYRPEEKQKLRPVKTLSDDNSLIGHVC